MDIPCTHQIVIFNPLELKDDNFINLIKIVFKEDPEKIKKFLQHDPGYWYSDAYPMEIAELFRHKLTKLSNELKLQLVLRLEKVKA